MQKQNNTLFKVASILLLIWGVIAVIVNAIQFVDIAGYLSFLPGSVTFGLILLLLSTVAMAVAGLFGTMNMNKQHKAGFCMTLGLAALAMLLLGTILILASLGSAGINWIFTIIGVILLGLFILGAKQFKEAPAPAMNDYGYDPSKVNPGNPYMNPSFTNPANTDYTMQNPVDQAVNDQNYMDNQNFTNNQQQ